MKTKSVLIVCFIAAAVFSASMVGYIFGSTVERKESVPLNLSQENSHAPITANPASVVKEKNKSEQEVSLRNKYILREDNGKISLFIRDSAGKETTHSSYDVPIDFLPENDRESLRKGIEFDSLDEIMGFVEDYVG